MVKGGVGVKHQSFMMVHALPGLVNLLPPFVLFLFGEPILGEANASDASDASDSFSLLETKARKRRKEGGMCPGMKVPAKKDIPRNPCSSKNGIESCAGLRPSSLTFSSSARPSKSSPPVQGIGSSTGEVVSPWNTHLCQLWRGRGEG